MASAKTIGVTIISAAFIAVLGMVALPVTSNCLIPETIPTGACKAR